MFTYLDDDILHRIWRAIMHTNVAGKRFAQIDVAEALRQQHKLTGGQGFRTANGRHVLFENLCEQCVGQILRFRSDHHWIDQCGSG